MQAYAKLEEENKNLKEQLSKELSRCETTCNKPRSECEAERNRLEDDNAGLRKRIAKMVSLVDQGLRKVEESRKEGETVDTELLRCTESPSRSAFARVDAISQLSDSLLSDGTTGFPAIQSLAAMDCREPVSFI